MLINFGSGEYKITEAGLQMKSNSKEEAGAILRC